MRDRLSSRATNMHAHAAAGLLTACCLLGASAAHAGGCVIAASGPPARLLAAETIDWTFVIASGQSCVRGLRSGAMLIESVSLVAPAKIGAAAVAGYGFTYRAPADYKG